MSDGSPVIQRGSCRYRMQYQNHMMCSYQHDCEIATNDAKMMDIIRKHESLGKVIQS